MAEVAQKYQDKLEELKRNVENWFTWFEPNISRYHDFRSFTFKSTLSQSDRSTLAELGKPDLEFNILEAFLSRQRGEFAKQQPDIVVRAADGVSDEMIDRNFLLTMEVIEGHLRAVFFDGDNDMFQYNVFSDMISGGFSVGEVYTDYVNDKSFDQKICIEKPVDPTKSGFDVMTKDSHKGDGRFCFKVYPMTEDEFKEKFGKRKTEEMSFVRDVGVSMFGWSYWSTKEKIIVVCEYYEKVRKKEKIVKLADGRVLRKKDYEQFLMMWNESGTLKQPPMIVNERNTVLESIERYIICENEVLEHEKTNFDFLPYVFFDGNSEWLLEGGELKQFTKPALFHAKDIQRLKNFSGQSLAAELENTIQHKFMMPIEAVDPEYLEPYKDVQVAEVMFYRHFLDEKDPQHTLPPPTTVQRTPIPPEITNTFRMSDEMTQAIIGSYDNAAAINSAQMSGVAFLRSQIMSNGAFAPYIVGYVKGLNRICKIFVNMIPKYWITPRSMPVLMPSGERHYIKTNSKKGVYMNYDANCFDVKVDVGVNFAVQKEVALQTMTNLMQASKKFDDFMNAKGLPILLDNIDIRGVDELKEKAKEYEQEIEQQQQQAQEAMQKEQQQKDQMQQMAMAEAQKELQAPAKNQIDAMKVQVDAEDKATKNGISEQEMQLKMIELMAQMQSEAQDREIRIAQIQAEHERSLIQAQTMFAKELKSIFGGNNNVESMQEANEEGQEQESDEEMTGIA